MSQATAGRGNPRGRPPNSRKQTTIPSRFIQCVNPAVRMSQDELSELEWPANVAALLAPDARSQRPPHDGETMIARSNEEVNLRQAFFKALDKWFESDKFVAPPATEGAPAITPENCRELLALARAHSGKREDRDEYFAKLVQDFRPIWEDSQKKTRAAKLSSIKNKECKQRANLRTGSRQYMEYNISELYPGLPLFNGCVVDNLPLPMMSHLTHHYGALDYQYKFQKHAKFINVSMTDKTLLGEFVPDDGTSRPAPECVCKKKGGGKCECGFDEVLEAAKFQSEGLFDVAAKEVRDAEFGLSATGKTAARKPAPTTEDRKARMNEFYNEQKQIWKGKSLKQYGQDHLKMSMEDQKDSKDMCDYLKLDGMWKRAPRVQYMMDIWGAPEKAGLKPEEVEPSDLVFNALDSTFFPGEAEAAGPSMCQYLVRSVLAEVFENNFPLHYDKTAEEMVGTLKEDTRTEKLPNTAPPNAWGGGLLEYSGMSSGLIRSGNKSFHQDLHIDDASLLGTEVFERMIKDPHSVSPTEWLEAGLIFHSPRRAAGSGLLSQILKARLLRLDMPTSPLAAWAFALWAFRIQDIMEVRETHGSMLPSLSGEEQVTIPRSLDTSISCSRMKRDHLLGGPWSGMTNTRTPRKTQIRKMLPPSWIH
jgi:hypothetical protein